MKKLKELFKKNISFGVYTALVLVVLLIAILAPVLATHDPLNAPLQDALKPPGADHLFGTDALGRDIFSRVLYGIRTSVSGALILVAVILVLGGFLGLVAGYFGGKVDAVIMRISDIMISFPELILAMAIAGILGPSLINSIIAITAVSWTKYARMARSTVLKIKNRDYIAAAQVTGSRHRYILYKYMLPNALPTMLVLAVTDIGTMMLSLASLSFLGFGVQPPTPEWGYMLSEGRTYILTCPWMLFCPGAAVFFVVVVFNLWGDSVRDIIDPKSRTKKKRRTKKMNRKRIATACAVALIGCLAVVPSASAAEKTQLNVSTELTSATLDPANDWDSWFVMRWGALETLTRYADDGTIEPWLASDWSVSDDSLSWTITLKDNVTFSNGEKMTASKVVESIERLYEIQDPENGGAGNPHAYMTYSDIQADDEAGTVTIVTNEPTVDMAGVLAYPWMGIIDVAGSEGRDIANEGPICTGPYVFVSNDPDHDIQMARNENYWDGDVPFETVNIMKQGEGSARAMALLDGSADVAINITAMDRAMLEADDSFLIDVTAGSRMGNCWINMDGVLGNDTLRQAVVMAIDGETICNVSVMGSYIWCNNAPLPYNYDYGFDTLENPFSYDKDAAIALLDDAGIVDTDGDGYRELDGENIEIVYIGSNSRQQDVIGQAQAAQLEEIGLKCSFSIPESSGDSRTTQGFDLIYNNEVTTPTGDPANYLKHWYWDNDSTDYNYGNYHNDEYNALYDQLNGEFDTAKRNEIFTQLQQIILNDAANLGYGAYSFNICAGPEVSGVHSYTSDFYWVTKDITPAE